MRYISPTSLVVVAALAASQEAHGQPLEVGPSVAKLAFGFTTLFTDEAFDVTATVEWNKLDTPAADGSTLYYRTTLDGAVAQEGSVDLTAERILPTEVTVLTSSVGKAGTVSVSVELSLDATYADVATTSSGEAAAQAIASGVSLLPLFMVLFLAMTLRKVEIALFAGVWLGACIVTGELKGGFTRTLDTYILGAVADEGHQFVILFTLFLSGLVGMMLRSGGIHGMTTLMLKFAKTPRSAALSTFVSGMLVFFDDYANCLVVGATMRPITDERFLSREKLAFIVDATAAPIASLVPFSSWVGYEVSLIQAELDKIVEANGGVAPDGLQTSGFAVFLESIAYRYYPIFLIVLQLTLATSQRDFGPMLVAERKVVVNRRKDGGDGAFVKGEELASDNLPSKDTPLRAYNMLVPVGLLVFLIIYVLIDSGAQASGDGASLLTIIQASDSYVALLYGTMGAAFCSLLFYALQYKRDGKAAVPTPREVLSALSPGSSASRTSDSKIDDPEEEAANGRAVPLLGPIETTEAFLRGMTMVFPAIVVLTLAWATGAVMTDVGCDRLFSQAIVEGDFNIGALPAVTFILSAFMALATGTSWGTMAIVFPLVVQPAWVGSNGDTVVFNAVIAAVLAGAVMGDHISPISDTTVLSSIAARCELTAHVKTQAPYALTVGVVSVLLGYLPVGLRDFSTGVAIPLGALFTIGVAMGLGAPVLSTSGRFDPLTELYMRVHKSSGLHALKEQTRQFVADGGLSGPESNNGGPVIAGAGDPEQPRL